MTIERYQFVIIRAKSPRNVKVMSVEFETDVNGRLIAHVAGLVPEALVELRQPFALATMVRRMVEAVNDWHATPASAAQESTE